VNQAPVYLLIICVVDDDAATDHIQTSACIRKRWVFAALIAGLIVAVLFTCMAFQVRERRIKLQQNRNEVNSVVKNCERSNIYNCL